MWGMSLCCFNPTDIRYVNSKCYLHLHTHIHNILLYYQQLVFSFERQHVKCVDIMYILHPESYSKISPAQIIAQDHSTKHKAQVFIRSRDVFAQMRSQVHVD